jgi:hypothetical protein
MDTHPHLTVAHIAKFLAKRVGLASRLPASLAKMTTQNTRYNFMVENKKQKQGVFCFKSDVMSYISFGYCLLS